MSEPSPGHAGQADAAPDAVAREYLLLGLSLGELQEGIVDSYFGPPELRQVALDAHATPADIAQRARELVGRLDDEVEDAQRREWLNRQLVAVETLAQLVGGEPLDYIEEVTRCFDAPPERTPDADYASVKRELDELLPGQGDVRDRLVARDERLTVPADRLAPVLDWLAEELRRRSDAMFSAPEGESLTVSIVTGQPWSAYNWYDGNLRSRVEVNTDLPVRAHQVIGTMAHETFPGHHLEHAWKEARLVREQGRAESSILLINTPEAFVSEGLAELGLRFVADEGDWQSLLIELCARADLPMTVADADREWRITRALRPLRGSGGDAAMLMHADGKSRDEVIAFLEHEALRTREQAEKNLEFISFALWRSYIFCYAGGLRLLSRWCDAAGDKAAQRDRFFRLLTEQLTPSGISAELA
ncbi:MAG TPA: hypothetical protein VEX62_05670 [Candidatus Limnocylindrales bacterium]|nr:hypothetical protein [Candidatus Limnocylindrales bacterium]